MSAQHLTDEADLATFERWTAGSLKTYLRQRGLRTSGPKKELAALAFTAHILQLPVKLTQTEKETALYKQYSDLLQVDGKTYPDPLSVLKDGWVGEKDGMQNWPPTMYYEVCQFLLNDTKDVDLAKRVFKDYKEKKGFSFLSSTFLFEVMHHPLTADYTMCFLKADCRPSQNIHNPPHTAWILIEKMTGDIKKAYCTCVAGRGQSCLHIAAILMKVDLAWKYGLTNPACTSRECSWLSKKPPVLLAPQKIEDMDIRSPVFSKHNPRRKINFDSKYGFVPHATEKGQSFESFLRGVREVLPNAVVFSEQEERIVERSLTIRSVPVVLPDSILKIAEGCTTAQELVDNIVRRCHGKKDIINDETALQAKCKSWHEQRKGRLTASKFHDAMTKTQTFSRHPEMDVSKDPFLRRIVKGESFTNKYVKYGCMMEATARDKYVTFMKAEKHNTFTISECGLVIDDKRPYIGASPDGVVMCRCHGKGILEIKCPFTASHTTPNAENCNFLVVEDGVTQLKRNHKYHTQVQGQMGVLGVDYCDFWVYSTHGHYYERIAFDAEFWSKLYVTLEICFSQYLAPVILTEANSHDSSVTGATAQLQAPAQLEMEPSIVEVETSAASNIEYLCRMCSNLCKASDLIVCDKENSIGCDLCGAWYHWKCVGLTKKSKELSWPKWLCKNCNV